MLLPVCKIILDSHCSSNYHLLMDLTRLYLIHDAAKMILCLCSLLNISFSKFVDLKQN